MLLGSKDTLGHTGKAAEFFEDFSAPMLVVSPKDLFRDSAELRKFSGGKASLFSKEITKRLSAVIDQYTGEYSSGFKEVIREDNFRIGAAKNIKAGLPFSYKVLAFPQHEDDMVYSGIVFVPGDNFDLKFYVGEALGIKPSEVTADLGSEEAWKVTMAAHEFWHLVKPEIIMSMMDPELIPGFCAAVTSNPQDFHLYQEIMCDFIAMHMAVEKKEGDPAFMQAYTDVRIVSALQYDDAAHRTGLAMNYLFEAESLPKLSILGEAGERLYQYCRLPVFKRKLKEKGIETPTRKQIEKIARELGQLSLKDMILSVGYLQQAGKFSGMEEYNVATTMRALERLFPNLVANTLGPMRSQVIESAKSVGLPQVEPEAPHYQAALTLFSDKTTIETEADGSMSLVRPDGTKIGTSVPEASSAAGGPGN